MKLTQMLNIGKGLERKLVHAGIATAEELRRIGSEEAFVRIKAHFPNVCLVHLMALEGAVTGTEYNQLPEERKRELKALSDGGA